jgi:hypothetical protein
MMCAGDDKRPKPSSAGTNVGEVSTSERKLAEQAARGGPRIQILIDAQTKYEFGKIADRAARCDALFARYNEHLATSGERDKNLEKDPFMEFSIRIQKEFQD